ncbi:Lar family restriction alleviation protein [Pectobacterium brasiliense]|uniref:Lar family restriction alleviation protein n=1 Tax=Pectobacterium brasiliense TaxID=180957 RepID=UPI0019696D0A|nr:Lar family restriction alleviation protein [Pectobacterium brasiliense]MBN3145329.1 Lar family restriction alleviation protein [Pectobacterium brasiliense]
MTDLLSKERLDELYNSYAEDKKIQEAFGDGDYANESGDIMALISEVLQRREAAEKPAEYKVVDPFGEITLRCEKCEADMYREMEGWEVTDLFTAPPLPVVTQTLLRGLVDVVWQTAKESTEVPSTKWADELIDKVFPTAQALPVVPDEKGLLPCPFCGCKADFDYDDSGYEWISCNGCGVSTDTAIHTDNDAKDILRKMWNRRAAMLPHHIPDATKMVQLSVNSEQVIDYKAIVERISEIVHGKVTDIDLLSVTVKSMAEKLMVNCPVIPDSSVPEALRIIGNNINTQDNRITDQPMFVVFQKREIIGSDEHSPSRIVWVWDGEEVSELRAKRLEALYRNGRDTRGFDRYAMQEIDEFVTACFTEQGCEDYLSLNGHNLRQPYIFACGSFRNNEYQTVRNWLSTSAPQHKGE